MKYKIYPSIGIARVGNSDEFFIGSEIPGSLGVQINPDDGTESPVERFKDDQFRVKRQAARFRVFQFPDGASEGQPVELPPGATIKWTVHLVNKKTAVKRTASPPATPRRPELAKSKIDRILDGGIRAIQGANASSVEFLTGVLPAEPHPNYLGELRTDQQQNLIILGGRGFSVGPEPTNWSFYHNEGWYDDVGDGPVEAVIQFLDGTSIKAEAGWVIVAPPDFAPGIHGLVTLYDVLRQVGIRDFGLHVEPVPSFAEDIYPLLKRAADLRWVNAASQWRSISTDYAMLSDPATQEETRRIAANVVQQPPLLSLIHISEPTRPY